MALRHGFPVPVGELRPKTELVRPIMTRPPVVVEFRRGADLREIARQVATHQSVLLDAAVGSGKSTGFPSAMAAYTKGLVMHVVPNPLLAKELYQYAVKRREATGELGVPLELMGDVQQGVPRTGVVYMSSAQCVAFMLHRGNFSNMGELTVFLDEAHESDACTYLVRTLSVSHGASHLVQASATMSPSGARSRETPGNVVRRTFPSHLTADKWQVDDKSAPWYYARITNNLLVFVDSNSHAKHLARSYQDLGMLTFRLEAGMDAVKFNQAMIALRDKKGPLVVLLADYSFRSGFTFDVDLVIDTGTVAFYDPTPGEVRRIYRAMFESESEQAAGRAGRIRSGTVEYYYPKVELERKICDLEGTEKEAAAFLARCLGYVPTGPLADAVMTKADLPASVNPAQALNNMYPLSYYVVDSSGRPRTPPPHYDKLSDVEPISDAKVVEQCKDEVAQGKATALADMMSTLGDCVSHELVAGTYYRVSQVSINDKQSYAFPDGLRSVRRFVGGVDGDLNVAGLHREDRAVAISLVLTRYNLLNVEIDAIDLFAKHVAKMRDKMFGSESKRYALEIIESIGRMRAERGELLSCLDVLTFRKYDVVPVPKFEKLVNLRCESYKQEFAQFMTTAVQDDDYSKYYEGLEPVKERLIGLDYSGESVSRHIRQSTSYSSSSSIFRTIDRVRISLPSLACSEQIYVRRGHKRGNDLEFVRRLH